MDRISRNLLRERNETNFSPYKHITINFAFVEFLIFLLSRDDEHRYTCWKRGKKSIERRKIRIEINKKSRSAIPRSRGRSLFPLHYMEPRPRSSLVLREQLRELLPSKSGWATREIARCHRAGLTTQRCGITWQIFFQRKLRKFKREMELEWNKDR